MKSGFWEGRPFSGVAFSHRVGWRDIPCQGVGGPVLLCPPSALGFFMEEGWGQGSESWSGGPGSWDLRCLKPASQKRGSAWVLRLQRKAWNILTGVETGSLGP